MSSLLTTSSPFLDDGSTVNKNYEANLQCHHHDMHSDLNRLEQEEELKEKMSTIIDYDKIVWKTMLYEVYLYVRMNVPFIPSFHT